MSEPTEDEVERAAKASWERTHEHMPWFEPAGDQARRDAFRDQARVMLRAAFEGSGKSGWRCKLGRLIGRLRGRTR